MRDDAAVLALSPLPGKTFRTGRGNKYTRRNPGVRTRIDLARSFVVAEIVNGVPLSLHANQKRLAIVISIDRTVYCIVIGERITFDCRLYVTGTDRRVSGPITVFRSRLNKTLRSPRTTYDPNYRTDRRCIVRFRCIGSTS